MVRSMSAEKIKRIMEREVDPRNALGTIDLDNIDEVVAVDQTKRYAYLEHCSAATNGIHLHVVLMLLLSSHQIGCSIYKQSVHLKCIGGLEVHASIILYIMAGIIAALCLYSIVS